MRCAKIKGAIFAQNEENNRPKTKNYNTDVGGARKLEARKIGGAQKLKGIRYNIY